MKPSAIYNTWLLGCTLIGAAIAVFATYLLVTAGMFPSDPTWATIVGGVVGIVGTLGGTCVGGSVGIELEDRAERHRLGLPPRGQENGASA